VRADPLGLDPLQLCVDGRSLAAISRPADRSLGTARIDGNDVVVYVLRNADGSLSCEAYFSGVLLRDGAVAQISPTRADSERAARRQTTEEHYRGRSYFAAFEAGAVAIGLVRVSLALAVVAAVSLFAVTSVLYRGETRVLATFVATRNSTAGFAAARAISWVAFLVASILAVAIWLVFMILVGPLLV
jgi:hypothetical protein